MRGKTLRHISPLLRPPIRSPSIGHRQLHISATPATGTSSPPAEFTPTPIAVDLETPDAQFEVLGAPYSLLSASIAASQTLYTRRGTLVGVAGKAENAVSTLSPQNALLNLALGIPFLYQKITSASPITLLISSRSPVSSFTTIHLDGTTDWMVAQPKGLLAWTGQTLTITPTVNRAMAMANWGQSRITGRGLLALAGPGQIYQIRVGAGESYVAHPANVLAYSITRHPPSPYRFKSSVLRLEVPGVSRLGSLVPDTRFFRVMRESETWQRLKRIAYALRTWSRRTIWGDRLFLQFHGPTTLLVQSRASRIGDVLTTRDVNEIAEVQPGLPAESQKAVLKNQTPAEREEANRRDAPPAQETSKRYVTVKRDTGEVKFEDSK